MSQHAVPRIEHQCNRGLRCWAPVDFGMVLSRQPSHLLGASIDLASLRAQLLLNCGREAAVLRLWIVMDPNDTHVIAYKPAQCPWVDDQPPVVTRTRIAEIVERRLRAPVYPKFGIGNQKHIHWRSAWREQRRHHDTSGARVRPALDLRA